MSRWRESTAHLYDNVDHWLAKYGPDAYERLQPRRDGPTGEERFTDLVRRHVGPNDTVVDIGTGEAGWLMREVAPHVRRAVGFDYAARRLWRGAQQNATIGSKDVDLLLADGRTAPLRNAVADAITSRRGPWTYDSAFMNEGLRILAPGGVALEIGIGERNACELEAMFGGRCQMHGSYASGEDRVDALAALCRGAGLEVLVAESYVCNETFASREALFFRLETTPTIDGFDPEADAPLVDRFIDANGLSLTVHRLVVAARTCIASLT